MKAKIVERISAGAVSSLSAFFTMLILTLLIVGPNHFFQALMLVFILLAISTVIAFIAGFLANSKSWQYSALYGILISILTVGSILLWSMSNI